MQIVELGDRQVGLVYKNDRLSGVLAPGTRQLYWRGPVKVRVEMRDISDEYTLDARTPVFWRVRRAGAAWTRRRSAWSKCRIRPWVC